MFVTDTIETYVRYTRDEHAVKMNNQAEVVTLYRGRQSDQH